MWDKIVRWLTAAVGAALGFFGSWPLALKCLAIIMTVDFITGMIVAWRGRSPKTDGGGLSSSVGFDGLLKKSFILMVVLMASILDYLIGNETMVFQMASTFYYIANESLSVLENVALMGVPIPKFLENVLDVMLEHSDSGEAMLELDYESKQADETEE